MDIIVNADGVIISRGFGLAAGAGETLLSVQGFLSANAMTDMRVKLSTSELTTVGGAVITAAGTPVLSKVGPPVMPQPSPAPAVQTAPPPEIPMRPDLDPGVPYLFPKKAS